MPKYDPAEAQLLLQQFQDRLNPATSTAKIAAAIALLDEFMPVAQESGLAVTRPEQQKLTLKIKNKTIDVTVDREGAVSVRKGNLPPELVPLRFDSAAERYEGGSGAKSRSALAVLAERVIRNFAELLSGG